MVRSPGQELLKITFLLSSGCPGFSFCWCFRSCWLRCWRRSGRCSFCSVCFFFSFCFRSVFSVRSGFFLRFCCPVGSVWAGCLCFGFFSSWRSAFHSSASSLAAPFCGSSAWLLFRCFLPRASYYFSRNYLL